jgi:hypothetical protein
MDYVLDEKKLALKHLVQNCNGEMRTLANLMQALQQYYDGLDDKPEILGKKHLASIISSTETADDRLAVQLMAGLYKLQFKVVQRALMDVQDPFAFIKKCQYIAQFMLYSAVAEGQRHPKVWWTQQNKEVHSATRDLKLSLGTLAAVNATIVRTMSQAMSFQVPATDLLSSDLYFLIKQLAEAAQK